MAFHSAIRFKTGPYDHPTPIDPTPIPWIAADQNRMIRPAKAHSAAPAEATEETADCDRRAKTKAGIKSWPSPDKENLRIVIGYVIRRPDRIDLNDARSRYVHALILCELRIAQITVLIGPLTQTLNRIHHIAALRQDSIAQLLRPLHILRHLAQHLRERK